jgi:hypothetical protein
MSVFNDYLSALKQFLFVSLFLINVKTLSSLITFSSSHLTSISAKHHSISLSPPPPLSTVTFFYATLTINIPEKFIFHQYHCENLKPHQTKVLIDV